MPERPDAQVFLVTAGDVMTQQLPQHCKRCMVEHSTSKWPRQSPAETLAREKVDLSCQSHKRLVP